MTRPEARLSRVKIFGERNTGTNALKQLIETNSSSTCLAGREHELSPFLARVATSRFTGKRTEEAIYEFVFRGRPPLHAWKHSATNFEDAADFRGALVLFTVRHPASWLLSLFRNPYHHVGAMPDELADFLQSDWKTVRRERLGTKSFRPLELYGVKLRLNLDFASRLAAVGVPSQFIRHEDLVLRQEAVFRTIAGHLTDAREDMLPLSSTTKRSERSVEEIQAYYAEERWRVPLKGLEEEINGQVDWKQVEQFGYSPL